MYVYRDRSLFQGIPEVLLRTPRCLMPSPRLSNQGDGEPRRSNPRESLRPARSRLQETETGGKPEVYTEVLEIHIELVPSGIVEVTPLQVDDSPLRPR